MKPWSVLAVWLVLLLLALQFVAAGLPILRGAVPVIGLGMAVLVALTFMRLGSSRGLTPAFALAGVFWLCILIGLGSLDSFTRHDIGISALTGAPRIQHQSSE